MRRTILLAGLGVLFGATGVTAGDFDFGFGFLRRRQAKADPAALVKQLVTTLQSDPDAQKRKAAAEELRELDARNFPAIVTALSAALQRDPSVEVRTAAVEALGRLKPVVQTAGLVMEAALGSDPDPKVREAVRSALWVYHLNGYRTAGGTPLTSQTPEPRLAPVVRRTAARPPEGESVLGLGFRPIPSATVGNPPAVEPTIEPPLATARPPLKPVLRPRVPAAARGLPVPEIPLAPRPVLPTPPPIGRNF